MNWLWVAFTIAAAAGQTVRNAMQRELTASLGALGATQVRFLFGFPFALAFLLVAVIVTHAPLPRPGTTFWFWDVAGSLAQIGGTALMLLTMKERSFVVTVAYLKTEPLFVAVAGLVLLKDKLTPLMIVAILLATLGVALISPTKKSSAAEWRPALFGMSAGALFAISAVGYRGAILSLERSDYIVPATFTLCIGLFIQATVLSCYLGMRAPRTMRAIVRLWRPSLFAGLMGATASELWFLAFALASAASVRTLGLVDVLFAQIISQRLFKQATTLREGGGILLLLAGAILLVWAQR